MAVTRVCGEVRKLVGSSSRIEVSERITVGPKVCGGGPCIHNLRFPVSRLPGLFAARQRRESILKAYPERVIEVSECAIPVAFRSMSWEN